MLGKRSQRAKNKPIFIKTGRKLCKYGVRMKFFDKRFKLNGFDYSLKLHF